MITQAHYEYEDRLLAQGSSCIAGLDEAGRGAWAGPVVAAAVILNRNIELDKRVRDSKQLSAKQRDELFEYIMNTAAVAYGIGLVSNQEIDRIGIGLANKLAMQRAVEELYVVPDHLLVDAFFIPQLQHIPQTSIIKGDTQSFSIAAASILAKVSRDRLMNEYDVVYPVYGLRKHKGYGTQSHREALDQHGVTAIHRRSFHPMNTML